MGKLIKKCAIMRKDFSLKEDIIQQVDQQIYNKIFVLRVRTVIHMYSL